MQPFKEEFEQYKLSTVGDGKVCSKCADIARQVFDIKDRTPGVNFPPLHPWCRCTFEIYVEDWDKWQDDYVKRHSQAPDKILQSFRQNGNMINDSSKLINHPDCSVLSPGDILNFLNRNSMIAIEALANNGSVTVLMKTKNSRLKDYEKFLSESIKQFSLSRDIDVSKDFELLNKFCDSLLRKGVKYGFKYIKC